ncbi:hypothetical protein PMAYCL1PPCAC_04845, partial [Pristionchus mayeri]
LDSSYTLAPNTAAIMGTSHVATHPIFIIFAVLIILVLGYATLKRCRRKIPKPPRLPLPRLPGSYENLYETYLDHASSGKMEVHGEENTGELLKESN